MVKKAIGNRHEARERKEKERCRVGFWAVRGRGREEGGPVGRGGCERCEGRTEGSGAGEGKRGGRIKPTLAILMLAGRWGRRG